MTVPPGRTVVVDVRLLEGLEPIAGRSDLAIGPEDIALEDGALTVAVHNVGAAPSPATRLAVHDEDGRAVARADIPAIEAPLDLRARTVQVAVDLGSGPGRGWEVVIDPGNEVREITRVNNVEVVPQ
jgi:hypothetical protein